MSDEGESLGEQFERVKSMTLDSDTWDLSWNDVAALKAVLADHADEVKLRETCEIALEHECASHLATTAALATARAEAAGLREAIAALDKQWLRESGDYHAEAEAMGAHEDMAEMAAAAVRACARELRALLASPEARDAGEGGGCDE